MAKVVVLIIIAGLFALIGFATFHVSISAIHEIEAYVLILIASCFFCSGILAHSLEKIYTELKK